VGATEDNIINAYQQLADNKLRLHRYNNDASAITNAIHLPACQLENSEVQPAFQQILNVSLDYARTK
jgi:hypothetical protein